MFSVVIFAAVFAACVGLGAWQWRRRRGEKPLDRYLAASLPVVAGLAAALAVTELLGAPLWTWNAARLAPAASLWHGYRLYYGSEQGPISGCIYPPLSALVYCPAARLGTPTNAVLAGSATSLALFFLPVFWLLLRGGRAARGQSATFLFCVLACFTLFAHESDELRYVAFSIHADAPALGFAALACTLAVLRPSSSWSPSVLASALAAVLAVWSKQTMLPVLFAIPIWTWLAHGRRAALAYLAGLAGCGLVVSGLFAWLFGPHDLLFNILSIPSRHPLKDGSPKVLAHSFVNLGRLALPLLIALVLGAYCRRPDPSRRAGAAPSLAEWLRDNRWTLFALAGLLSVPMAVLGMSKVGGGENSFAPPMYYLLIAVALLLLALVYQPAAEPGQGRVAKLLVAALTVGLLVLCLPRLGRNLLWVERVYQNDDERAYRYARAHPGEAYFPWSPLATVLAEGKLYHFDYGVYDRNLAGFPVTRKHFLADTPPGFRLACYPTAIVDSWAAQRYLKDYSRRVEVKELPEYNCYEKAD